MTIAPRARADIGLRAGPRIGLERHDDMDLALGADVRLSFPMSPLTLNPTFDYFFDENRTLFQVSLNALYYLPTPIRVLDPYLGIGAGMATFAYRDDTVVADGHGSRFALNLIGGVCFDVPIAAPVIQAMVSLGEVDLITVSAGFLFGSGFDKGKWDPCGRRPPGTPVEAAR